MSKEILGSDSESGSEESGDEDDEDEDEEEDEEKEASTIIDNTETNLITLRRTIYLTIQSSLDFEECAHKLMKMELKPGQEIELCHMFLGNTRFEYLLIDYECLYSFHFLICSLICFL